jgi:hypothetical protein
VSREISWEGRSLIVVAAVERLWAIMADDYGLLPDLAADAALARADGGELVAATPRLVELAVGERATPADAAAIVQRLGAHPWLPQQRRGVEDALDGWWVETLEREPGTHRPGYEPGAVLGMLVGYGAPMVRWLDPWLHQLDGPGARHLADLVLAGGPSGPTWTGHEDQALQVMGWARTETVINGLALVGGTHLPDGVLSDALDRLL